MSGIADHHPGVAADELRREDNEAAGRELCENCGGTGNEFFLKFKACSECGGTGCAEEAVDG